MLALATLLLAAMFVGAAVYIPVAEHPARRRLDPRGQLTQWQPSYARGAVMQAGLALASGLGGVALHVRWGGVYWLIGGIAMLSAIAWTFAVMWKLNGRMKATPVEAASAETVAMLDHWARLHLVRMALSIVSVLCYAVALYPSLA